jgi:hypothetical protein
MEVGSLSKPLAGINLGCFMGKNKDPVCFPLGVNGAIASLPKQRFYL